MLQISFNHLTHITIFHVTLPNKLGMHLSLQAHTKYSVATGYALLLDVESSLLKQQTTAKYKYRTP